MMVDSKGRENANANDSDDELIGQRRDEATSKETLNDIEKSEQREEGAKRDPGPSPDGQLDEPDEIKDAGPM